MFIIKNKTTGEIAEVDFEGIDGAWYLTGFNTLNNGEDVISWKDQKDWEKMHVGLCLAFELTT